MADQNSKLCMKFDIIAIKHLGVSMYAKLPPVIAELVANSWDANATKVDINLIDDSETKLIEIKDNGKGMSFDDINNKFLFIGKNRRTENGSSDGYENGRRIIGRKGIGKLSVFGVANDIIVTTVRDGIKNRFKMSYSEIESKAGKGEYEPQQIIQNEKTDEKNGTSIQLSGFKRKSAFNHEDLVNDLAKRFLIFDANFVVDVKHNSKEPIRVDNSLRFKELNKEFEWTFPNKDLDSDYEHKDDVTGTIYTTEKPVCAATKGIYLVARGKLVNENEFYGLRESDYAFEYMTGWLNVDFIDEDARTDNISTNRESLNWENDKTESLRKYLQKVVAFVARDWRERRNSKKIETIKAVSKVDVNEWIDSLAPSEKPLAKKMSNIILKDSSIEVEKSAEIFKHVIDIFKFESFKDLAEKLSEDKSISALDISNLLTEWKVIEAREFYKLALVRIQTINKFENFIKENAKEVPTIHKFLSSFSWLLDPRIMNFKDEVTYSKILREKFPDDDFENLEDRRIDFLCVDFNETIFIIELKRPEHKANEKTLQQAVDYSSFIETKLGNENKNQKVEVFVICGGIVNNASVKKFATALRNDGSVYIRDYNTLLKNARNYHQEFIDRYNQLQASGLLQDE